MLRRSTDGGVSFGPAVLPVGSVPGFNWQQVMQVFDAPNNRHIVILGNGSGGGHSLTCQSNGLAQVVSTDRGLTFAAVEHISRLFPVPRDRSCISPPGGIGIQLKDQTLLVPATHHAYQGDVILRSYDGGKSYNVSDSLHHPGLDEMQLVQLNNGSVMSLARNCVNATGSMSDCMMASDADSDQMPRPLGGATSKRVAVSISDDGGSHWSLPRLHQDLVTPVCNFGVTSYMGAILFSGPHSATKRQNLTVLASSDDGLNFSPLVVLVPGPAGYSNIQCGLPLPYDCGVLYSTQVSREIRFVRFQYARALKVKTDDSVDKRLSRVPAPLIMSNLSTLQRTRAGIAAGDFALAHAVEQLKADAEAAMVAEFWTEGAGPWSVMNKSMVGASGDKHDYFSTAKYCWPCDYPCNATVVNATGNSCDAWTKGGDFHPHKCDNATGLPWLCHDGFANPINDHLDRGLWDSLYYTVPPLALSAFLTGNATQAQRAAMLVRVWFLDEKSRMNPNLNYAQAIPGANNGTDGGIIDISDHHKLL
jgi:hypothetical protein